MILSSRDKFVSALDNRLTMAITITFILYFFWMDVALYRTIQNQVPLRTGPNVTKPSNNPYSPFSGLSIKMMMMDQFNHYVETPLAQIFNVVTGLSTKILWITPNMISISGLIFALAAARCAAYDHPGLHLIGIIFMVIRGFMDALDGLVARDRIGVSQSLSIRSSSGYVVDGVADTIGYTAYLIGCFIYLKRNVPKQKTYLPLATVNGDKVTSHTTSNPWTSQRIFLVVFCFGMQIAAGAALWDHYCDTYHKLLETPRTSDAQAIVQNEVLKSTLTWIVIWCWKVSNSHALMNLFLGAVFVNKMWVFLTWIQFIGFVEIFTLFVFTEIHLHDVQSYIETLY